MISQHKRCHCSKRLFSCSGAQRAFVSTNANRGLPTAISATLLARFPLPEYAYTHTCTYMHARKSWHLFMITT